MCRMVFATVALPLCVAALWAVDGKNADKQKSPPAPAQQFVAIEEDYAKARAALLKAHAGPRSEDEQVKFMAQYDQLAAPFAARCVKLAEEHPKDPIAVDALAWVLEHREDGFTPDADKAARILARHYARDPGIYNVCRCFLRVHAPAAEELLRAILAEHPAEQTRAAACFALAQMLAERADDEAMHGQNEKAVATRKDAENHFEQVGRDFADIKIDGEAGKNAARKDLQELRTLAVGKTAPDIKGKDSSGKNFRLSDYRGKVVVLDFWARW